MRPIEFRGMTPEGKWVYGDFVRDALDSNSNKIHYGIQSPGYYPVEVIPSTIGQFTGLVDANGTKIWEGDKLLDLLTKMEYVVKFGLCKKHAFTGWYCESEEGRFTSLNSDIDTDTNHAIEVIGNIHEGGKG